MSARLVVMVSGSGTNLQALLDACAAGELAAHVVAVVSNRRAAFGLERARRAGVEDVYFPLKPYRETGRSRDVYDRDLGRLVAGYRPDLIVMAGWMHITGRAFLDQFDARQIINLHPALPGAFPGLNGIERSFTAFRAGDAQAVGCMVHYVIPEVDAGEVIATRVVPVLPADTNASTRPSFMRREPTTIEDCGLRRMAWAGASCMSMLSGAWTSSNCSR